LEISAAATGRARIQNARIGSSFNALRHLAGGSWEVYRRYPRADMPATLHVGLTCYTDWNSCSQAGYEVHNTSLLTNGLALPDGGTLFTNPDLEAAFDYMRYRRPEVPAHLAGRDVADPEDVPDAELLAFLGDHANTPGGSTTPARILSPQFEPDASFSMVLELRTNRSYRVQGATSLDAEWTAAGVISGAGGVRPGLLMRQPGTLADGDHAVALTGRVYCNVDATAAPIEPGDLITTSDTPGHGMKVTDHGKALGAIIGKAMTGLDRGRGQILVLVSLQ
jgi:hypothetical protein